MSKTIPQILLLQVSVPHYSLALFARFICTCTTFAKKKKICIQTDPGFLSSHIEGSPCK